MNLTTSALVVLCSLCVATVPAVAQQAPAPPSFRVTVLPTLAGANSTSPAAVNDNGEIAGTITSAIGFIDAAYWAHSEAQPVLVPGLGATFAASYDINAAGVVVGAGQEGALAFRWELGEDMEILPAPGLATASAIDDTGVTIVGTAAWNELNLGNRATRWVNGVPELLESVPGDNFGAAYEMNASGLIVGVSGNEAAVWSGGPGVRLDVEGATLSTAFAVNDAGLIVGEATADITTRAIQWQGGVAEELPTLGGNYSSARAVNNAGWVVGLAQAVPAGNDANIRAALWIDGVAFDLNALTVDLPPNMRLVTAAGLNELGQIVGDAFIDWLPVGFALDPLPRSGWTDLGHGLAGSLGVPTLTGSGPLTSGTPMSLTVAGAAPASAAWLVLGFAALEAPFKGGVLVPVPTRVVPGLLTGPSGGFQLGATWPGGVPSGFSLFVQVWIADAGGPAGLAATNGVRGTTP